MTARHKQALAVMAALVVLHELALHAMAQANVVARLLFGGVAASPLILLTAAAFIVLRLCVLVLVPALLAALLFDLLFDLLTRTGAITNSLFAKAKSASPPLDRARHVVNFNTVGQARASAPDADADHQ
jgi:hypothetical protein